MFEKMLQLLAKGQEEQPRMYRFERETWLLPGLCGLPLIVRAFVPKEMK